MLVKHIYAFILGMKESRETFCTSMTFPLEQTYDRGRGFARALTLHRNGR